MKILKRRWLRVSSIATALAIVAVLLSSAFSPPTKLRLNVGGFLSFEANVGISVVEAAITVTALGTDTNKGFGDTRLTYADGLVASAGDWLIVVFAGDVTPSQYLFRDDSESTNHDFTRDAQASNAGNVITEIWSYKLVVDTASNDYVSFGSGTSAKAMAVYKVTGIDDTPFDKSSTGTGSGTTGSSGVTATLSQADEIIIGAVGVEDEVDDLAGTWTTGAGYVSGNEQKDGTNGAGDASNISIYSAAEIVSATTAQEAEVTGMDNVDWAAAVATYKMASGAADISNSPSSIAFGTVSTSTTYWSDGAEPSWPLVDADAYFTLTNNGGTCSVTILATNFTGGVGWTLGTPASDTVRLTVFKEGDGSGDGVTLTTSAQAFISALSTNIDWELKMETPTIFTDGAGKTSTITLTATLD